MALEELLNKIVKKGWKPRDIETLYIEVKLKYGELHLILPQMGNLWKPIRLLVSKESGLRQFCVENKLVKEDDGHITRIINLYKDDGSIVDGGWDYHYWLMICSILDESDLEQFLIDNIKI